MSAKALKITLTILFMLVFLSLGLNLYLIWQLLNVQQQAQALAQELIPRLKTTISQAAAEVETFQESTVTLNVQVDEDLPVAVNIPFNETIEVPIKVTVPIREEINTTIVMDPFQAGLEIPVDVTVPVNIDIPIDVVIPVSLDRPIPISTTVPIHVKVPVAVEVGQTDLAGYAEQLHTALTSFNTLLDQILTDIQQ
jgi:hypothetical protein